MSNVSEAGMAFREAVKQSVRKNAWLFVLQGILMVVAGVAAIAYPLLTSVAMIIFLGWTLIIVGVIQGMSLITAREAPHFWLQLISVALGCIIGAMMVWRPEAGLLVLTMLLIVYFMVEGISKIVLSLTVRPLPNWGWVLASGVVGVVLSVYLIGSMPLTAAWLLGLLLGINLISEGAALVVLAWRARSAN
ncbi:MAG: HdeD family acid-resistance protein [Rhodospirillales bacterium]|nr:MAG: HdeD family acid-resistance protein [Rhodospirillales bacterium]